MVCAVEGESVGSVFFGSRTLREELSKPESRLESWFSWISSFSIWSGVCSSAPARARQCARGKAGAKRE